MRRRLEQINGSCRQIQRDLDQRISEGQKLEQDLDLAVRKDKDEVARMLIRKRRTLQGGCEQLQHQLEVLMEEKGKVSETLEQQRLQYDQLKVKAAAYCRQAEQRQFEESPAGMDASFSWQAPSEEEVELELLQRKEKVRQGGAA